MSSGAAILYALREAFPAPIADIVARCYGWRPANAAEVDWLRIAVFSRGVVRSSALEAVSRLAWHVHHDAASHFGGLHTRYAALADHFSHVRLRRFFTVCRAELDLMIALGGLASILPSNHFPAAAE